MHCWKSLFLFYFLIIFLAFNNIGILAPAVAICFLIKISAKRTSVETAQRSVQRFIRKLFLRKLGKDFELRSYFQIFQSYSPFLPKIKERLHILKIMRVLRFLLFFVAISTQKSTQPGESSWSSVLVMRFNLFDLSNRIKRKAIKSKS